MVRKRPGGTLLVIQVSHCKHFSSWACPSNLECVWVLFLNINTPCSTLFNLIGKCQPSQPTVIPSIKWLRIPWLVLISRAACSSASCCLHAKPAPLPPPSSAPKFLLLPINLSFKGDCHDLACQQSTGIPPPTISAYPQEWTHSYIVLICPLQSVCSGPFSVSLTLAAEHPTDSRYPGLYRRTVNLCISASPLRVNEFICLDKWQPSTDPLRSITAWKIKGTVNEFFADNHCLNSSSDWLSAHHPLNLLKRWKDQRVL